MAKKGTEFKTVIDLGAKVNPSFNRSFMTVQKGILRLNNGINSALKSVAVAGAALAAAAGGAAVAAAREFYQMGESWDKASDTIRIGTGATGKALEELNESMQRVYAQLPSGKGDVASAIADINTLTGAEGKALEAYASAALKASKMLGADVKSIYTDASKAFNAFNIPAAEMADKLNHLWKVSQATGTSIDKLAQGALTGQATFRQMNFSFEQATSLLGQLDKAGVRSEAVLAAMKKGVVELAKAGAKDFGKAFNALSVKIRSARSETEAINIAGKVFGAKGGGEIAKALRDGRLSAEVFTKSLKLSSESIDAAYADTADFAEKMTPIKHKIELALKPVADTVFAQINNMVPVVGGIVEKYLPIINKHATELSGKIKEVSERFQVWLKSIDFVQVGKDIANFFTKAYDTAKKWLPVLEKWTPRIIETVVAIKALAVAIQVVTAAQWLLNVAMAANPVGLVIIAIVALIAAFWYLYDNWEKVCAWFSERWEKVCNAFRVAWNFLVLAMTIFWENFSAWVSKKWNELVALWNLTCAIAQALWDGLCSGCKSAWESTKNGIATAWDWLGEKWDEIVNGISSLWDTTCDKLKGAWDGVKNSFSSAWDSIKNACARAIDWMMDKIQPFLDAWDAVKDGVSGVLSKIGIGGDDEPEKKARGGFTHGLSICGEAGTEAVISFDPRYREQNQGYLMTAAEMLGMFAAPTPASASRVESRAASYNFGGISITVHADSASSGASIKTQLYDSIDELCDRIEENLQKRASHRYA